MRLRSCFQCGKVNKFESDSQHEIYSFSIHQGCFQCGKVNKFESDSQQIIYMRLLLVAVSSVAKLINLKAIHNDFVHSLIS